MKIGYFTEGYLPQLNGVATSVEAWAKGLEKLGHKVYIIAPEYPGYKDRDGVIRLSSFRIVKQPDIRLAVYLPIKSMFEISKMDFDIVHGFSGGTISTLGLIVARLKKIPFVFAYYTRFNHYTHYFLNGKVINAQMIEKTSRIFCNKSDCIITPASKIKDELISFGVKKPIIVIPSGVDLEKFNKKQKGYLRKKTGIIGGKILLYVGRLGKEKSVDFLLYAFQLIHDRDSQAHFVLVGDGPEKNSLKQLAKKLNIERNVYFMGLIDQMEMGKVYTDCEIFVFASQTETQGMVILEALASGVPVVAVKDSVYDGIIKDKMNGILVDGDPKMFAAACLKILNNISYRKKLSDFAAKSMQEFSLSVTALSFEKLYKNLISQKKK